MSVSSTSKLIVLLLAAAVLSQCAAAHREAASGRKAETIAEEIKRVQSIAYADPDPSRRAGAHLRLARLYSSYRNPSPDYRQALTELEIYLAGPHKVETTGVLNLHALLRELERKNEENRKAMQALNQCTRENEENRKAKQALNQCARENRELRGAMEELKKLDLKMEEERKRIR